MKKYGLILLVVVVAACVGQQQPPTNQLQFAGQTFNFRSNLTEATTVPVLPDETSLSDTLLQPDVHTVYMAFLPNDAENGYYAVTGYGLAYKLTIIYRHFFGSPPAIETLTLNSTDELNASTIPASTPVIWLRGPAAGANTTAVTVNGNLVSVEGADLSEINRTYTDLDLAAEKLLLVLMQA